MCLTANVQSFFITGTKLKLRTLGQFQERNAEKDQHLSAFSV